MGYNCKKAIGKLKDGTTYTVWYTSELQAESNGCQYANKRSCLVSPCNTKLTLGNLKVTYTVSKISFSPVPVFKI